jgi:hypothetical protein
MNKKNRYHSDDCNCKLCRKDNEEYVSNKWKEQEKDYKPLTKEEEDNLYEGWY